MILLMIVISPHAMPASHFTTPLRHMMPLPAFFAAALSHCYAAAPPAIAIAFADPLLA